MNYTLENFSMKDEDDLRIIGRVGNFLINDIVGALKELKIYDKEILYINDYYARTQEEKDAMILDIIEKCDSDKYVICTTAFVSTREFPASEWEISEDFAKERNKKLIPVADILKRDSDFLEKHNFININEYVGYEFKEAYVFGNDIGQKIVEYLNNINKQEASENGTE